MSAVTIVIMRLAVHRQANQTLRTRKASNDASFDQAKRSYRIAVIPGDGIGKEVVPEGVRALEAAAEKYGFKVQLDEFDFASCDYYLKHNKMMPDDWKDQIGRHDAIFFGAVGWPEKVPDHISLWGSLIQFVASSISTSTSGRFA